MLVWVVGAGGLLGGSVCAAARDADAIVFASTEVPWNDTQASAAVLSADLAAFVALAAGGPWAVAWCAGSSVVASGPDETDREMHLLTHFVDSLAERAPPGPGVFFLASSAGGVYAGSVDPPFSVTTRPAPVSPYGHLKLQQERVVSSALAGRVPVVIGRLSNLYGPRTDPTKGQGLVPLLCRAVLHRRPLNLYVSMDTIRDYLYSDDAGRLVWNAMLYHRSAPERTARIEVIASGNATTVAQAIAVVQNVAHRKVPLALGTHASAQHQPVDLRMIPSTSLPAPATLTPLPAGVKLVLDSVTSEVA